MLGSIGGTSHEITAQTEFHEVEIEIDLITQNIF